MVKILANDGIAQEGIDLLEKEGFEVKNTRVAEEQLANYINKNNIEGLLVRSATKVNKKLIDDCPGLKLIGRGGVGLDNIDVKYAESKGIQVFNTPEASSESVAELVFAHLLNGVRYLHDSNRNMPLDGDSQFKQLKKSYAAGLELRGKTLGIVGFGRIGQATARMALALGMEVLFTDHLTKEATLSLSFFDGQSVDFTLKSNELKEVLANSDFVSLHVPAQDKYLIGKEELRLMKPGSGIINTSRGGVLDEVALVEALDSEHLAFAGLDVYESEPNPEIKILMNPKISLSPHIGGSTLEAQERIGIELADKVIKLLKKQVFSEGNDLVKLTFSYIVTSNLNTNTMSGLLDLINSPVGKQLISGVAGQTGQPENKTAEVLSMAMPLLMGAMKKNASTPGGAQGLMNALSSKHDGGILDDLGGLFGGGVDQNVMNDGAGILGHVLGSKQSQVENALSAKSGIDAGSIAQILKIAAPILLGYLGKQTKQQNVSSPEGLNGLLGGLMGGTKTANKQQSLIETFLDSDGDGSVIDDLAGMVLNGGNQKKSGLGGVLGGLFGKQNNPINDI